MYEEFFRFSSPPFRLNPDPKFFFGSRSHNKAMAYLHYGLRQGEGFIVITGEIGAGKSMLISHLMDQLDRSNVVAAHLLTTNLEPSALLSHILSAFRIEPSGKSESAAIEAFEDFLFDQMNRGRRVLLVVDEAQNLPIKTIEELRMLSNMDYDGTPLFQVFLVGQPEFRAILSKPNMEQFRQRVIANYHLEPLTEAETAEYIRHRLSLVGWTNDPSLAKNAVTAIFAATGGVPRKINKLCNRIFLFCALEKRHAIDVEVVNAVVADLEKETLGGKAPAGDAAAAEGEDSTATKQPAQSGKTPASAKQPQRAVAAGGTGGRSAAKGGKNTRSAPVVIPFEQARRVNAKDVAQATGDSRAADDRAKEEQQPDVGKKSASSKAAPSPTGQMSVLDRLRAQREAEAAGAGGKPDSEPETAATLSDVAKAIEEASAGGQILSGDEALDEEETALLEASGVDSLEHRPPVVKSINEMRDELKTAHQNITRLRRRLSDIDKGRRDRRQRISSALAHAESLLAEIRNSPQ